MTEKTHLKSDFIGPWGQFELYIFSGAPLPTENYLTIFQPFDTYVWAFLVASIMAISGALIFINKIHSMWSKDAAKDSAFESTSSMRFKKMHNVSY